MALTATKTEAVASSQSNFIDGRFVATGKSTFENRDPVTGELVNLVAEADATMVDDALKATTMGPPISQQHRKKVLSFYGEAEGAHRVAAQIEVGITWVNAWFLLRSPHAVRRLETVRHRPRRRRSFDGTLHRTAQRLRQTLK
jgi:acyl-CoA reductase-like NAD-dependent aldehyde dehydrogenase